MNIKDIEEYVNDYYEKLSINSKIKEDFEKVLIKYLKFHIPDINKDTFFCSIHQNFKKEHNCVACNLQYTNERIINYLLSFRGFDDINTTYSIFIMLLYLQVECIFEYINIIRIPEAYVQKNFRCLYKIKRWANFLKHPKSFLLVHHPIWRYEEDEYDKVDKKLSTIIDNNFVDKYFKGDKLNNELYKVLAKKEFIVVLFPNPIKLIEEYCTTQKKFKDLISSNQLVRDILGDEASIKNYFENENYPQSIIT